jgi:hypothetical protein
MAIAQTEVITFDDLGAGGFIPNGYAGLQWQNFRYLDGVHYPYPSGYQNAVVSPNYVTDNWGGFPAMFSGPTFNLNSAYLTAAFIDGLQVEVQGFVGTTLTYDNTYTVNTTGPTLINFNYLGVDKVNFSTYYNSLPNYNFAMDNLSITIVPEPTTFAMVGLGSTALFMMFRRRK